MLKRLTGVSAAVLLEVFDRRRPRGRQLLADFLDGAVRKADSDRVEHRDLYDAFAQDMLQDGFRPMLDEYPVLAGLIESELESFRLRTAEMSRRLAMDLPRIGETLGWRADPGGIVAISPSLSDPHRHGRSVAKLVFESGSAIVYKPRDLEIDVRFNDFWRLCDPEAAAPRFVPGDGYGWMELVEEAWPGAAGERHALWVASGRLLAVLYLLGATDCHWENVIVHGTQLVLVDAETVLQPPLPSAEDPPFGFGGRWPWDSALRTGLTPGWMFSVDGGGACDPSGLGRLADVRGTFQMPHWRDINTDAMTVGREPAPLPVGGREMHADVDALIEGFSAMYRRLVARRRELEGSAAFRALAESRLRFVLRPTQSYAALIGSGLEPAHLRSEAAHRQHLHRLAPLALAGEGAWSAIRDAELEALARGDIPFFTIEPPGDAVRACNGQAIALPGIRNAFADARERFAHLGEADLARQAALVRASFQAVSAKLTEPWEDFVAYPSAPAAPDGDSDDLTCAALAIADRLVGEALRDTGEELHWLGLHLHEATGCHSLQRLGYGLYEGNAGIALFLATAAGISGRGDLAEAAIAALAPIRRLACFAASDPGAGISGLGSGTGVGSLVYAFTRCASLLGRDDLLSDAVRIAAAIDEAAIEAETCPDALSGLAGAVIALLALHESAPSAGMLEPAARAGRRLQVLWEASERHTGLAHGAAGIALAFARLAAAGANSGFAEAARQAVAFERENFDDRAVGWLDLRYPPADGNGARPCSMMWCHGAPGIGLGRLALLTADENPDYVREIEAAIDATLGYGLRRAEHLCCGNFGRIDLLVEASLRLDRPELHARAMAAARARLDWSAARGDFDLGADDSPASLKPTLFRGLAGIGYQLLRIASPRQVPTVLTWN
ncbi:MAG TPA: type 2 lanthipeptide synthetase LanM family protein [Allosphingosinicella sp.]